MKRILPSIAAVAVAFCLVTAPAYALNRADLVNQSEHVVDGWYYNDWFGYFEILDNNPAAAAGAIYHNEHGDLWVTSTGDAGWWMECMEDILGVFYIVADSYPSLHSPAIFSQVEGYWGFYVKGSAPKRSFFDYGSGSWSMIPAALRHRPDGPHGPVPFWWVNHGLLDLSRRVSNHSPVTVGQLKNVAATAKAFLDARLDMRPELWEFAFADYGGNPFPLPLGDPGGNHGVANLGQLKYLASGFYRVLHNLDGFDADAWLASMGVSAIGGYPWDPAAPAAGNRRPANIGQLKLLFSFPLDAHASARVQSSWVGAYLLSIGTPPHADPDGDGLTNLEEFLLGTDPTIATPSYSPGAPGAPALVVF